MIFFAKYLYLVIIFIAILYFLLSRSKKKRMIILGILSLPLTFILAKLTGLAFYDPRPFVISHFVPLIPHAANNGFPSDHALISFALASLIFVFNRKLGIILFALGILVGASRVYVGIHFPIDILGSFIISVFAVFVIQRLAFR